MEGRSINALDEQERRKVAVIGQRVKDQLFAKGERALGADITINGISFQVIGVTVSLQQGNQQQEDEKIYLPNDTLRYAFNQTGWIGSFMIIPKPGIHAKVAEDDVKKYLVAAQEGEPGRQGCVRQLQPAGRIRQGAGPVHRHQGVQLGGRDRHDLRGRRGVGNIMLIVVKERTREIGLRKALGATPRSIVGMIMQESLFITAVAGYSGLVVGALLLEAISKMLEASGGKVEFLLAPGNGFQDRDGRAAVLILSGVLASIMPAAKAAAVNPIVALQDE